MQVFATFGLAIVIRGLARKHRVEPDQLAGLGKQMREQLAAIEAGGERIEALDAELRQARLDYAEIARELSGKRHVAASKLDSAVESELAPLKLDSARFRTALAEAEPGPSASSSKSRPTPALRSAR